MKQRSRSFVICALAVCLVGQPRGARALEDHDHDRARDLFERNEILSLREILRVVAAHVPGEIVTTELVEEKGGGWIYCFLVVGPNGRRTTVEVDAHAGGIIDAPRAVP
jgi:uncharacterized membrane protein YkoI